MSWQPPSKRRGWRPTEEAHLSLRGIIYNILEVVPGGTIRAGKTSYSDTTNTGFWLGVDTDSLAKFHIGSTSYYLKWTGTRLEISGSLRTKNGYVQIVDESEDDYGEGITLLQDDWLSSGGLRWIETTNPGAIVTAINASTAGTALQVNAYPRAAGSASSITLTAQDAIYGAVGANLRTLALNSAGTLESNCPTALGGATDAAQLTVIGCEDGQTAALIVAKSDAAATVFAVANSGAISVAGNQVIGSQQSAIADVTETGSAEDGAAREKINDILAALRAHGLIDT